MVYNTAKYHLLYLYHSLSTSLPFGCFIHFWARWKFKPCFISYPILMYTFSYPEIPFPPYLIYTHPCQYIVQPMIHSIFSGSSAVGGHEIFIVLVAYNISICLIVAF